MLNPFWHLFIIKWLMILLGCFYGDVFIDILVIQLSSRTSRISQLKPMVIMYRSVLHNIKHVCCQPKIVVHTSKYVVSNIINIHAIIKEALGQIGSGSDTKYLNMRNKQDGRLVSVVICIHVKIWSWVSLCLHMSSHLSVLIIRARGLHNFTKFFIAINGLEYQYMRHCTKLFGKGINYCILCLLCRLAHTRSYSISEDRNVVTHTVYPKKYAHGFCFAVLCCGYTLTGFPISIRLTSLALWQSNDCPSASKATLMNMDKYFMWIHYERLHNHNKANHNKTVCIFLGIYCICSLQVKGEESDKKGHSLSGGVTM